MINEVVQQYLAHFPEDKTNLDKLLQQLKSGEVLNNRRNFNGHITGAGLVLSADRSKILLIHHNIHQKWLQPGGHWENDESDPLQAAEREIYEETGLHNLQYVPLDAATPLVPVYLETHYIAANPAKDEPEHWHHDFRYLFISSTEELIPQLDEVAEARWFALDAPEIETVRPIINRLKKLNFVPA